MTLIYDISTQIQNYKANRFEISTDCIEIRFRRKTPIILLLQYGEIIRLTKKIVFDGALFNIITGMGRLARRNTTNKQKTGNKWKKFRILFNKCVWGPNFSPLSLPTLWMFMGSGCAICRITLAVVSGDTLYYEYKKIIGEYLRMWS